MANSKQKYNPLESSALEDEDLPSFTLNSNPSSPLQKPLEFQDFSTPFTTQQVSGKILQPNQGTSSFSSNAAPIKKPTPTALPSQQAQSQPPVYRDPSNAKIWHVEYYSKYFDVDTNDVLQRLRWSLYPNSNFLTTLALHKDLYGPFWVPTTLIFTIFVSSSLAHSIVTYLDNTAYLPDITRLSTAASVVYIYTVLLPFLNWCMGKYLSKAMEMIQIIGIFGYSLTLWIPVSLLCIIPIELVRWILVLLTMLITGAFVSRNLHALLTTASPNSPIPVQGMPLKIVMLGTICAQIIFALLLKFLFFSYTLTSTTKNST
ncbi:hypothetical protein HMI54_004092 [Coelomomyces lativittatus]|nr:hypothetical protein HMI54_004092 [Coelomomyces lativittatus]KAJ1507739.1 hypothetical protein HMI56_007640 [Coelomomyces lativittatus]